MLKKIIGIKGVGPFAAYAPKGDVFLRQFTAIWGPNGVGKTTLCDILRSFSTADVAIMMGRRSLGTKVSPEVDLLFDSGKRSFRNGTWDAARHPQIHIFDNYYIHENVFIGDFVEHDQKKNLYRVIVGEQGVTLAETVDSLDEAHREATKDAGSQRDTIRAKLPSGLDVDSYVDLVPDAQIDAKIQVKEKEVTALHQAQAIGKRSLLSKLTLPSILDDIDTILATTIDGLSADAEHLVREHIAATHAREAWLSEGLRFGPDHQCPFCGQDTTGTALLPAYRAFFSESYGALKEKVGTRVRDIASSLGPTMTQQVRATVVRNDELGAEWAPLIGETWDRSFTPDAMDAARDALLDILRRKEAAPLEFAGPVLTTKPLLDYQGLLRQAAGYNAAVDAYNAKAQHVKEQAKAGKLQQAELELAILRVHRKRFENAEAAECVALKSAIALREQLEDQKTAAKKQLDHHAATILGAYQEAINRYLQKFGAAFRIKQLERRYAGGTPSSSYVIEINNTQVELGDRKTSIAERSFRNTLSAGDRSALALAFFLSQIERDDDLGKKIVVLDDPFTSQDRSRRLATQQEIRRIRSRAAQVIVFSHDDAFLSDCCSGIAAGELKTLQLRRVLTGPLIEEWNVDAPRGQALQDRQRLKEFLADGGGDSKQLRDVARVIRPLLEAYLRGRFLAQFKDTDWLADMITTLRQHEAQLPEGAALSDELTAINEFSRRYHHAENPGADNEPIDETELRTYIERALAVADGF